MKTIRLSLPTVLVLVALVGAGAFAAGQSLSPDSSSASARTSAAATPAETVDPPAETVESDDLLPPGHPPPTGMGMGMGMGMGPAAAGALPAGHPPVDSLDQPGAQTAGLDLPQTAQKPLEWQAPARWQLVPSASTFRLATYRIPHAPGDTDDGELSVARAGGSVDANAERWVGQFDPAGQKTAKRAKRKVGALEVTLVDVQGEYTGGMGKESSPRSDWALLGAIVSSPGMPHFFKLTGPAKSVRGARAEFDAMIGSLVQR